MVLGMSLAAFTLLHVVVSLIGIGTGIVVVIGMFGSKVLPAWTAVFLASTILTSLTGFLFPFEKLLPSHIVGVISLVVLALAQALAYFLHWPAGATRQEFEIHVTSKLAAKIEKDLLEKNQHLTQVQLVVQPSQ
jgi:hypothetical protein